MRTLAQSFVKAENIFITFTPNWTALITIKWFKWLLQIYNIYNTIKNIINTNTSLEKDIADLISNKILSSCLNRPNNFILRNIKHISITKRWKAKGLNASHRTWIGNWDKGSNSRIVKELNIMYHDANRAGKHLDVHLGHLSIVIRVNGKPVESQIKYNNKGELTQISKDALINHLRAEVANNSRMVWNHDHTLTNARSNWLYDIT